MPVFGTVGMTTRMQRLVLAQFTKASEINHRGFLGTGKRMTDWKTTAKN